ncbi:MAG: LCP family protein [Syntrophales bacterium]|nr:LCP family protein [Syntrophales bacterium]
MDIYRGLNRKLQKELNYFPRKKRRIYPKKITLRIFQGLGIFLIFAISFKIISLPGISFSMEDIPTNASIATLEKPESAEVKAEKNISLSPLSTIMAKELKGENEGQINFLILGTPGKGNPAPYLTDSIVVLSLDLKENPKVTIVSIPRDLLVRIPEGYVTKINSLYILDKKKLSDLKHLEILEKTIEDITSLKINYFVVMELEGLGKLVDAVGGVRIFVDEPIFDSRFPKPGYGYETFIMPAGWQDLSGEIAEKYVRVRHAKGNDYGRMARQQQIIEALREKVTKLNLLSDLPTFLEMERILSSYFETNISKEEGARVLELAKNITQENIIYKVIDPSTGLITSGSVNLGGTNAFVLWPKAGQFNYSEIQKYIKSLIGPEEI